MRMPLKTLRKAPAKLEGHAACSPTLLGHKPAKGWTQILDQACCFRTELEYWLL